MGWLTMQGLQGFASPRAYLDAQFTYSREDHQLAVLRSAVVGLRTYYAACERLDGEANRSVFAVVCLFSYNPAAKDGYSFGYKDMDETVGPCESDCPESILDLLTPTGYPHAIEWRARCRSRVALRQAQCARPTPRAGQTIIFDEPIRFSNGRTLDTLHVVANSHGRRGTLFRDPQTHDLCRISHVKRRAYRLINPARASSS
ncbi:DUF6927 domain-containing protein [Sphingomonas sp. 10B4]|uniref:DUF6927 domain-containing protein n=1 Tax=Sphingomonas sp. 10B4 TaxID=3048575 RepID=UPI002AB52008|nr:hypothetical protein [Sphingomonas sp. 10B4]MDY7524270.1 hypothetical protein [Sphingomonas sp. 10B4]MEB0282264.1 hypothetical protein [Sphingomonas sp. 10B4]